jgi:hypothetical protein
MPRSPGKIANVATITPRVRSTNVLTGERNLFRACPLPEKKQGRTDVEHALFGGHPGGLSNDSSRSVEVPLTGAREVHWSMASRCHYGGQRISYVASMTALKQC